MASIIPRSVKKEIIDGWVGESLYLMLVTSGYTPNINHVNISSVSAYEASDSGGVYPAGGVALTNKKQEFDPGNTANAFLDAADLTIGGGITMNYRYGVIYKKTGSEGTSPIRCIIDFNTNQTVTNGTISIQWNSLGIIYIS